MLDPSRERRKALDRYSPSLSGGRTRNARNIKRTIITEHTAFFPLFPSAVPSSLFARSTISYSRNPGWQTPGESERISNGRKKSDNSPPATPNGDGKEEEPCDLILVYFPHTISKREAVGCCTVLQATGFLLLKRCFGGFLTGCSWSRHGCFLLVSTPQMRLGGEIGHVGRGGGKRLKRQKSRIGNGIVEEEK